MSTQTIERSDAIGATDSSLPEEWLPVLLLLFVGSGAAALIYEIVWFQMLELFVGSSSVSIGVLLGTFMGGMCLGSFLLPRYISPRHHPLRVYAFLEIAIGVIGLLLLFVLPLVGHVYTAWGGYGISGYLLRGLVASICLLPPTLAMGATLPAVARWVQTTPSGVSWLGFFYAGNIAGAVMGTLLAGFYLLRVFDMSTATYVAVAINFAVGGLGLLVAARTPATAGVSDSDPNPQSPIARPDGSGDRALVYVAIGLSGFCALAAQVVWTRILSLLFGASTYTFSLILAVFLIGLGIGSSLGSMMAKSIARPRVALGWCQLLNVGAMAWSAYMLMKSLPYWPINTSITTSIWYNFQLDFVRAFWAVLPAPILWGASFPLAQACRRRLCRQYGWRDLRFGGGKPHPRVLVWLAARATGADGCVGHVRPAAARARRVELVSWQEDVTLGGAGSPRHRSWRGRVSHQDGADHSRDSRRIRAIRGNLAGTGGRHLLRGRRAQLVCRRLALRRDHELPQRG